MTREERVRRWVDGELDAADEEALFAEAADDPALAALIDGASDVQDALDDLRADSPAPSPDLVERSVQRALASGPPRRRFALAAIVGPLSAAAVVALTFYARPDVVVPDAPLASVGATPAAAPLPAAAPAVPVAGAPATVPVRFALPATGAHTVAVAGDFNGWRTDETILVDDDGDGVFTGTRPIAPGSYAYMFVVDGQTWVTDPAAGAYRDDGFGNRNAVLRLD